MGLNLEALQREVKELSSSTGSKTELQWANLEDGVNEFRILPIYGPSGTLGFRRFVYSSYNMPDKSGHVCIEKTWPDSGKICPIMAVLRDAQARGIEVPRGYWPRQYVWLSVLDRKVDPTTPKLLRLAPSIMKSIIEAILNPRIGDITDPDKGYDISITKSGTGLDTEYSMLVLPGSIPIHEDKAIQESIVSQAVSPWAVFKVPTDEVLAGPVKATADIIQRLLTATTLVSEISPEMPALPVAPRIPASVPKFDPASHPKAFMVATMIGKQVQDVTPEDIERVLTAFSSDIKTADALHIESPTPLHPSILAVPPLVAPGYFATDAVAPPATVTAPPITVPIATSTTPLAPSPTSTVRKPEEAVLALGIIRRDNTDPAYPDCFGFHPKVSTFAPRVCRICSVEIKCKATI